MMEDRWPSIEAALANQAKYNGGRAAIVDDSGALLTFGEWFARSVERAVQFNRMGIVDDIRVGLCYGNSHILEYAVDYFAVILAGGIACPIPTYFSEQEVKRALDLAGISWRIGADTEKYVHAATHLVTSEARVESLAEITFISGASGVPQLVCATVAQLAAEIKPNLRHDHEATTNGTLFIHAMPIGTRAGQSMLLHSLTGKTLCRVLGTFSAKKFFDEIAKQVGPISTALDPSMVTEVIRFAAQLSNLRFENVYCVSIIGGKIETIATTALLRIFPNANLRTAEPSARCSHVC